FFSVMFEMETHISCLFPEILAIIFSYLEVKDKGRVAQVCAAWRDASYHKSVWRGSHILPILFETNLFVDDFRYTVYPFNI
uniref:F-box domain-containing protein n=1 Tax=Labrus bergylta TaxID=56723 RepID=A0A3Q3LRP3_9LABR